jgi:hypothetical protein
VPPGNLRRLATRLGFPMRAPFATGWPGLDQREAPARVSCMSLAQRRGTPRHSLVGRSGILGDDKVEYLILWIIGTA